MISVIVPVFMVEKYLDECIQSILRQTFNDFELILIDDGSKDKCPEICDHYSKMDKRVKTIHQKNQGLSAARNAGINIAEGDFITFIDSDDVISKIFLDRMYSTIVKTKADVSICGNIAFEDKVCFESTRSKAEIIDDKDEICSRIYKNTDISYVAAWGKMYRHQLFENIRFPVGKIHEDQFTTYQLYLKSSKNVIIKDKLYGYRQRKNSIMNQRFSLKRYEDVDAIDQAILTYKKNNMILSEGYAKNFRLYIISAYSLLAREVNLYKRLPQKYRMNLFKAIRTIQQRYGYEAGEYIAGQYYPRGVKLYSCLRKLHLVR